MTLATDCGGKLGRYGAGVRNLFIAGCIKSFWPVVQSETNRKNGFYQSHELVTVRPQRRTLLSQSKAQPDFPPR
jgi:hypothetical protein